MPLSDLALTVRLTGAPYGITTHPGSRTTSYLRPGGPVAAFEMATAERVDNLHFL